MTTDRSAPAAPVAVQRKLRAARTHCATRGAQFTAPRAAVLEVLLLRGGKAISKEKLFEKVFSLDATTSQDVVEIYIHRLRKHLLDSGLSIVTLRGLGYLLEAA